MAGGQPEPCPAKPCPCWVAIPGKLMAGNSQGAPREEQASPSLPGEAE